MLLQDILSIHVRRGGIDNGQSHSDWLSTVSRSPNVISMSFIPIASLLSGIRGSGFLSHAINLYLRCEWAHLFLNFLHLTKICCVCHIFMETDSRACWKLVENLGWQLIVPDQVHTISPNLCLGLRIKDLKMALLFTCTFNEYTRERVAMYFWFTYHFLFKNNCELFNNEKNISRDMWEGFDKIEVVEGIVIELSMCKWYWFFLGQSLKGDGINTEG